MRRYWGVAVLAVALAGCSSKEERVAYYDAQKEQLILQQEHQIAVQQAQDLRANAMMHRMSQAMAAAAETVDTGDDIAVALVFSQMMTQQQKYFAPPVIPIKPPTTGVDYLQAMTPIVTGGIPWLAGAWLGSSIVGALEGAGTSYNVSHGGKVVQSTANNSAGGDLHSQNTFTSQDATQTQVHAEGSMQDVQTGTEAQPGLEACMQNPPAGRSIEGVPMYSPDCSCQGHFNGLC